LVRSCPLRGDAAEIFQSSEGVFRTPEHTRRTEEIPRNEAKGVFVREKGTVKWFNGAKGYGFIQRSTGYRTLNEGETVEFDLLKGPKGFQAANVVRA
jgi:cold shock protein